ncbi:MAG: TonB-dependent receptor [Gemmatimonadaceae bacterium]
MTTASILANKAWIATAALVLVTGVAEQVPAQAPAVITGTVTNTVTGGPVTNATVRVVAGRRFSATGGDGRYRLVVDAGQAELRITAVGFAPVSQTVSFASGVSRVLDFALQPSAVPLDDVVALGTRALERTAAGSAVPVDVISAQLLENTGLNETWQQLQRVVPSVNVPHIPIGDNHMRPVTLRGLAPHHVLVLVNGKRRHPASVLLSGPSVPSTGLTDLNAIPSSAIERIEVLRDGAAAQYGSDAIGGVVNVILKSGQRRDLQTSIGSVYSSEGGRDFQDGRLFEASTTLGFVSGRGGHLTLTGELRNRSGTNRAYPDRRQQYFTGDPRNAEPPRISSYLGNGTVDALSFFLFGVAPVTRGIEAYMFGGAADRHAVSPDAFFRRPLDSRTVRAIQPEGFLPEIGSQIRDLSLASGMRGSLRGWRWDLSSAWGGNATDYRVQNSNNASLGAASPTEFCAGKVAAQQWTSNLDVVRNLKIGSFPLSMAGGAEFRVETYQIRAGEPDSWRDGSARIPDGPQAGQRAPVGAQGMFGFRPLDEVSARRSSSALYLETEGRFAQRLLLQSAVRAEHYSDFGSTSDGKVAARIQLLRGLALRGSVSTGFRAPSLTQQHISSTRTVFQLVNGVNTVLAVRTFPVNSPEAQLIGATPLRPETALNRSAGVVLDLPRFPRITADLYRVTINDRIGLRGSVTDTSLIRLFEQNGLRGIGGGNYFSNATDTRTQGVDIVASHALLFNRSHVLRLLGGYNNTRTVVTDFAPLPPQLARFRSVLLSRVSGGPVENGQPRQTIALTVNYSASPLSFNLHNQRSGPTAQLDLNNPDADQIVGPKWITDARLSYQLRPRLQVALSGANLFDVYPDEWNDFKDGLNAQGISMQGIFRHPGGLSAFGMNGRTLYLRLAYH